MEQNKSDIITSAIAGGLTGAALGALLTGKTKGALASLIAGAAIGASIQALEKAKKTNIPILYEENGSIYKLHPNGEIEFIKDIKRQEIVLPETFSLV